MQYCLIYFHENENYLFSEYMENIFGHIGLFSNRSQPYEYSNCNIDDELSNKSFLHGFFPIMIFTVSTPTGKALALLFFLSCMTSVFGHWWNAYSKVMKQAGSAYTNLCSHICKVHKEVIQLRVDAVQNENWKQFEPPMCPKWSTKSYGWNRITNMALQFIYLCAIHVFKQHIQCKKISKRTISKLNLKCTKKANKNELLRFTKNFAIEFDGCFTKETHFEAIFATFTSSVSRWCSTHLSAMLPMRAEDSKDLESCYALLKFAFTKVFKKSKDLISAIVDKRCRTNCILSQKFDLKCVGCYSSRFSLAVQDDMKGHATLMDKVH